MRAFALVALALVVLALRSADAAPIGEEALRDLAEASEPDREDLGEGVGITEEDMDMAQVGELADYGATKKKLEDEIKKIEDGLAKKKAAAKKTFDENMKSSSQKFQKMFAAKDSKNKELLESPIGVDGQSGVSGMAKWAYSAQIANWSKAAHHKIAKLEKQLEQNRFTHFSTAVCKEVLASKVEAIGDLHFKQEETKIDAELKKAVAEKNRRVAFDRADMEQKVHSYSLWEADTTIRANGGLGGQDPGSPHMLTTGEATNMGAGRVGELKQAAHWAFANSKAGAYANWEKTKKALMAEKKKITQQHDLTLCRTGRKPESPQLKYELQMAKEGLKKQLNKMPGNEKAKTAEVQVAAAEDKVADLKAQEKKAAGGEAAAGEGEEGDEDEQDLGESESVDSGSGTRLSTGEAAVEFHKLVDASGGTESLAERVKMYKDLVESEQLEQQNIVRRNVELGEAGN